jgi:hypothetical protein
VRLPASIGPEGSEEHTGLENARSHFDLHSAAMPLRRPRRLPDASGNLLSFSELA